MGKGLGRYGEGLRKGYREGLLEAPELHVCEAAAL
jgi:hypothetical protein